MNDITVEELRQKREAGEDFIFLDVREAHEYQEFNLGARLIPLGILPAVISELMDQKDKEIVVHCRSGARSGSAKITMTQMGFSKVRNLLGGVLEWQRVYGQ
ncbi:MAG: rhodanese-like domain-containing protein [Saprospiraceae bacterium]